MWMFSQLLQYYYHDFVRPMYDRKWLLNLKVTRVVTFRTLRYLFYICLYLSSGARVAQWWAHWPKTNVALVQIPALTPYVNVGFWAEKRNEHAWTSRVWKNGGISNIFLPNNKTFPPLMNKQFDFKSWKLWL